MEKPCVGDCANYTIGGLTLYACDPVSVCSSFGIGTQANNSNSCVGKDGLSVSLFLALMGDASEMIGTA
ncbi:hypothetical protein L596_011882 [Steinernema carpocapsae]|uniref:Uncharacterized protein n=1 Tax=Steinernema carpocapsae TaxID=34508 RepID=A0A4U5NVR6_STECR|nr:hypothetical protein L596_011882 [Steinernema carpocapsae]